MLEKQNTCTKMHLYIKIKIPVQKQTFVAITGWSVLPLQMLFTSLHLAQ